MSLGGKREGAGRKPGPRPVSAGRIGLEYRRMAEKMAAHSGQSVRRVLEAAIWEAYRRMRVEWDPSREFPLEEEKRAGG